MGHWFAYSRAFSAVSRVFFFFQQVCVLGGGGCSSVLVKGFLIWAVLQEHPPSVGHPPQILASDDTVWVRLTSSLIGWNQFLQEPPVINVRVLRSHSFLLAAAAEEALQGSWTSSPMCVCVWEEEEAKYVCVRERREAEQENVGDYCCRGCCMRTSQLYFNFS